MRSTQTKQSLARAMSGKRWIATATWVLVRQKSYLPGVAGSPRPLRR